MAGSINLSLSQQFDITNGRLLSGGRLFFFQSGTTTPQNAYKDSALTLVHPNPITLASDGRIPQLYFADGSIKARLDNRDGVVQFNQDNILVIGASSGEGGGGSTVDATAIYQTGDMLWNPVTGTRVGWVRANGRTIGSATSGAAERANSDVSSLFSLLWTTYPNTICPVSGGRGVSAAADFAADKQLALLDMRGRGPFGLDDMGNSAAGLLAGATFSGAFTSISAAGIGGEGAHTLATSEIPAHTHAATVTDPGHIHTTSPAINRNMSKTSINTDTGISADATVGLGAITIASAATGVTVANANAGGGGTHNNMPPFMLGTYYIKL